MGKRLDTPARQDIEMTAEYSRDGADGGTASSEPIQGLAMPNHPDSAENPRGATRDVSNLSIPMTTPISCAALLAGCLMLSACAGERATCVRKSTGETLHGTVMRYGDGSIREYDMADENGLVGAIDVTSSRYFKCKVAA